MQLFLCKSLHCWIQNHLLLAQFKILKKCPPPKISKNYEVKFEYVHTLKIVLLGYSHLKQAIVFPLASGDIAILLSSLDEFHTDLVLLELY